MSMLPVKKNPKPTPAPASRTVPAKGALSQTKTNTPNKARR